MKVSALKYPGLLLITIYFVFSIIYIHSDLKTNLWDFRTYYYATQGFNQGMNPYDIKTINTLSPIPTGFNYVYPPLTLYVFKLLTHFEYTTAATLYLYLKSFILLILLFIWGKYFLEDGFNPLFYLFCLLAFNSPIYIDLVTGNISIWEQLFLWMGFLFLLKRNLILFCGCILVVAFFKVTPIIFLLLIFLIDEKKKNSYFIGSCIIFLLYFLLSYLLMPVYLSEFFRNAMGLEDLGFANPSTMAFVVDISRLWSYQQHWAIPSFIQMIIYLGIIIPVIILSYRMILQVKNSNIQDKEKYMIFLFCILYALVIPRFKSYSYILLLVPSYYILTQIKSFPTYILYIVCIVISAWITLPGLELYVRHFPDYFPLMLAYMFWWIYILQIRKLLETTNITECGKLI